MLIEGFVEEENVHAMNFHERALMWVAIQGLWQRARTETMRSAADGHALRCGKVGEGRQGITAAYVRMFVHTVSVATISYQ